MNCIFLIAILAVVVGVFLMIDTDFPLYVLPNPPENAFEDKVVWITGASSGIGASLAGDMARAGAQVVISARREDKLLEVVKGISEGCPSDELKLKASSSIDIYSVIASSNGEILNF